MPCTRRIQTGLGRDYKKNALRERERVDSVQSYLPLTVVTYTYTLSGIIGMHDHVQQSFSPSLTHRYYIRHAGNCPVLSVNIESMDDVTSGVAHALVLLKAITLSVFFFLFSEVVVLHNLGK